MSLVTMKFDRLITECNYDMYPSLAYYDTINLTDFFPKDPKQCIKAMHVDNLDDFKDISAKWNLTSHNYLTGLGDDGSKDTLVVKNQKTKSYTTW